MRKRERGGGRGGEGVGRGARWVLLALLLSYVSVSEITSFISSCEEERERGWKVGGGGGGGEGRGARWVLLALLLSYVSVSEITSFISSCEEERERVEGGEVKRKRIRRRGGRKGKEEGEEDKKKV